MKRLLVLGTGLLVLGGCALPLPVQVASWAIDGISYLATQKSMADHGISALARKDCAVLRGVLKEGEFCREFEEGETVFVDAQGHSKSALAALDVESGAGGAAEIEALANFDTAAGGDTAAIDLDGAETNARPLAADDTFPLEPPSVAEAPPAAAPVDPMADFPLVVGPEGDPGAAPPKAPSAKALAEGPPGAVYGLEPDLAPELAPELAGDDADEPIETGAPGDVAANAERAAVEVAFGDSAMVDGGYERTTAVASDSTVAGADRWQALTVRRDGGPRASEPSPGLYFVIGSFRRHDNARALRGRYRMLTPAVLAAGVDGATVFRVVVGPFAVDDAQDVHRRIFDAGISDSWAIRVRPGEWSMAMVDPPAEATEVAAVDAFAVWHPMRYVRMLTSLIQ